MPVVTRQSGDLGDPETSATAHLAKAGDAGDAAPEPEPAEDPAAREFPMETPSETPVEPPVESPVENAAGPKTTLVAESSTQTNESVPDEITDTTMHGLALRARNERLEAQVAELRRAQRALADQHAQLSQLRTTDAELAFERYRSAAAARLDGMKHEMAAALAENDALRAQVAALRDAAAGVRPPPQSPKPPAQPDFTAKPLSLETPEITTAFGEYAEKLRGELAAATAGSQKLRAELETAQTAAARAHVDLETERHLRRDAQHALKETMREAAQVAELREQLLDRQTLVRQQRAALALYECLTRLAITSVQVPDGDLEPENLVRYGCVLRSSAGVLFAHQLLAPSPDALLAAAADASTGDAACSLVPQLSEPTGDPVADAAFSKLPSYFTDGVELSAAMLPRMFDKLSSWAAQN